MRKRMRRFMVDGGRRGRRLSWFVQGCHFEQCDEPFHSACWGVAFVSRVTVHSTTCQ
jgi:hypothetical protein